MPLSSSPRRLDPSPGRDDGYRSRAAFKLIQLNRKFEFLQKSKVLLDLCAAPGGWLQVAQKHMPVQSVIIGVDLVPIKSIHNVITLQEDITTQKCRSQISKELKTWKVDTVLHDGAPNVGKSWIHDAFEQNRLTLSALHLACDFLIKGGWFVTKVFRSKDYNALMWVFNKLFKRVFATKPQASRNESAEIFVVCQNFIAPDKIDPKFFDPTSVFAEIKESEQRLNKSDLLKPKVKKAKAEGYEDGEVLLYRKLNASEFVKSANYLDMLGKASEIVIDMDMIRNSPSTTDEIVECLKDIKVLGRKELVTVMNWRKQIRDEMKKHMVSGVKVDEVEEDEEEEEEEEENDTNKGGENGDKGEEEEEEVLDSALSEEAQKLKRKRRKVAKEKRKLAERMNLKMVLKNDQLVQEEQDLFNLKAIRKQSQMNAIKDVAPEEITEGVAEVDDGEVTRGKKRKVTFDKDASDKFYDPDDSDVSDDDSGNESDDDEETFGDLDPSSDEEEGNELIVDLEDKESKVKRMTKMFFDNKIFKDNFDEDDDDDDLNGEDSEMEGGDDDEIELQELENSYKKKGVIGKQVLIDNDDDDEIDGEKKQEEKMNGKASDSEKKSVSFADSSDSDSEEDEENKEEKPVVNGHLSAEELALGAVMIKSKKAKRDLLDDGWNRYVHEDDEFLPSWFRKEEQVYFRKPMPVSGELVKEYNTRLKEINSKPIKKVMEAKARKKKRAMRKLEKARLKAETLTDDPDMTTKEKAEYIRNIYKKALRKKKDKPQLVIAKKQYGNRRPPGVRGRYKIVDSRLKKDMRKKDALAKKQKGKKGRPKVNKRRGGKV